MIVIITFLISQYHSGTIILCMCYNYVITCVCIYRCYLCSGYLATPFELFQTNQDSEDLSSLTSLLSNRAAISTKNKLYSASTYALGSNPCPLEKETGRQKERSSSLTSSTKDSQSLGDLDKLEEETSLFNTLSPPQIVTSQKGQGAFHELSIPPPLVSLPSILEKKLAISPSSPDGNRGAVTRNQSERESNIPQNLSLPLAVSKNPPNSPQFPLALLKSSTEESLKREVGESDEKEEESSSNGPSVATRKLLQRARVCSPGVCNWYTCMCTCTCTRIMLTACIHTYV